MKSITLIFILFINFSFSQIGNLHTKMQDLLPNSYPDTIEKSEDQLYIEYYQILNGIKTLRGWELLNTESGLSMERNWQSIDGKYSCTAFFNYSGNIAFFKENLKGIRSINTFYHDNGIPQLIYYYKNLKLHGKHLEFDKEGNLIKYSIYKKDKLKRVKFQIKK